VGEAESNRGRRIYEAANSDAPVSPDPAVDLLLRRFVAVGLSSAAVWQTQGRARSSDPLTPTARPTLRVVSRTLGLGSPSPHPPLHGLCAALLSTRPTTESRAYSAAMMIMVPAALNRADIATVGANCEPASYSASPPTRWRGHRHPNQDDLTPHGHPGPPCSELTCFGAVIEVLEQW